MVLPRPQRCTNLLIRLGYRYARILSYIFFVIFMFNNSVGGSLIHLNERINDGNNNRKNIKALMKRKTTHCCSIELSSTSFKFIYNICIFIYTGTRTSTFCTNASTRARRFRVAHSHRSGARERLATYPGQNPPRH